MYKKTNTPRWHLLTTVSAVALLGSVGGVQADDATKPVLWIELGGQLEQLSNKQEPYAPPFVTQLLNNPFTPPAKVQAPPRFSIGEEGRISFQPEDSDWVFSAALRYGRANRSGHTYEKTAPASAHKYISIPSHSKYASGLLAPAAKRFATTVAQNYDTDLVLDFQAGKDVGLGLLGAHGSSTFSAGVRIAQFRSRSHARLDSDPNFAFSYKYLSNLGPYVGHFKIANQNWDLYKGQFDASRTFKGIGPSLQWDATLPLMGQTEAGAVTLDWGVNGAILFGKQRMRAHEQTTAHHGSGHHGSGPLPLNYQTQHSASRSRSVTVPNLGGFAGLSLRYPNAKISIGYRADFFFGAIDGGIATRKSEDRGFFGPFVSISAGLGD